MEKRGVVALELVARDMKARFGIQGFLVDDLHLKLEENLSPSC